ncbi:hypothetical protein QWZ08_23585 [Ferruginibacter paludis]|uniref:hypothetical protein n=1 Tax=Ferruginibacter paludis TaxID=1310417 RepID=UPI0025B3A507|nr:hypothetical protein [Ferruginibacter paludis]MDN3658646.1 hypothetical protein [Ferruginibacter paludis]
MTFIRLKKSYPRATKTRIVMNENALLWNPLYLSCWIPAGKKETESIPLNYRVYYKNKTIISIVSYANVIDLVSGGKVWVTGCKVLLLESNVQRLMTTTSQ